MPVYSYHCTNPECVCLTFDTTESIKSEPLKICPYCGDETVSRIPQVFTVIDKTPKTLGGLADTNKIGNYKKEDLVRKYKEDAMKASKYLGKIPEGAESVDRKPYIPFWRTSEKVDRSLAQLSKPGNEGKLEKFIMTGKKNV